MLGCSTHFDLPSCCSDSNSVVMHFIINQYFSIFVLSTNIKVVANSRGIRRALLIHRAPRTANHKTTLALRFWGSLGPPFLARYWRGVATAVAQPNTMERRSRSGICPGFGFPPAHPHQPTCNLLCQSSSVQCSTLHVKHCTTVH